MRIQNPKRTILIGIIVWLLFFGWWFRGFLFRNWRFRLFSFSSWRYLIHEFQSGWQITSKSDWIFICSFILAPFIFALLWYLAQKVRWHKLWRKIWKILRWPFLIKKKKKLKEEVAAYEPKQPAESFVYRPQAMPATVIRTQNTTAPTQSQETFLNSSTAMGNFSDMTQKPVKNNDSFPALPIFPSDMGEPKQEPFTNEAFAQMANIRLDDIELPKMETVKEDIPDLLNKAGYVVLPEEVAKEKGVDLIALSATQIFIAQYDKHEGEWLADEESFNEEDPLWFSETDHRVSPVFQLKNKAALIREKVGADFHVRPVLFEQVGNIINAEDMMKTWNDLGVTVCRTASGGPVELPIAAEILKETQEKISDETLEKVKALL